MHERLEREKDYDVRRLLIDCSRRGKGGLLGNDILKNQLRPRPSKFSITMVIENFDGGGRIESS